MHDNIYQFYQSYSNKLCDICKPLQEYLGIQHFGYLKILPENNRYFYFSTDEEVSRQYLERVTHSSIFFEKYIAKETAENFNIVLWPPHPNELDVSMQVYFRHGYWNGVTFVRSNADSLELWWFAGKADGKNMNDFYIRNISVLERFILFFQDHLAKTQPNQQQNTIASFKSFDYSLPDTLDLQLERLNSAKFLEAISLDKSVIKANGKFIHLSKREMQCLGFVSKGFTMKTTARELGLSPRTVETYINIVKEKIGYRYKSDLIKCFQDSNDKSSFPLSVPKTSTETYAIKQYII